MLPTLAVIRLAVMDENNKLLGHRVLPVEGLRPGTEALTLSDDKHKQDLFLMNTKRWIMSEIY